MKNALKTMAMAMAVVGATAISASAATLSLLNFTGDASDAYVSKTLTGTYSLGQGGGVTIDYVSGDLKNNTNGLSLSGPADIIYTYIGFEAGNTNFSLGASSSAQFSQSSVPGTSTSGPFSVLGGLLDFAFQTTLPSLATITNNGSANPNVSNFAIGFKVAADGQSAFIYFDDIASGDQDFDDFVVRVNVVPVPAAGFLLLGALGGLAALRRRKTA